MTRFGFRTIASAIAAGFLVAAVSPVVAQSKTFVFTAIPDQDETRLVERFTKVAEYLQQKLGTPVRYLPVKSYPAAVTAFTNDQVQLAWFGGFTGVQARRAVPGSEAIAQGAEDVAFKSYVIANARTVWSRDKSSRRGSSDGPSPSAPAPRPPGG
jgi:phosphonate transport system substrate-binding protein